MAGDQGVFAVPPPPHARGGTHRRRHRRGQGRQTRGLAGTDTAGITPSFHMLPGSSMFCKEANEAHIALLSTLPPHMANSAALLGAPIIHADDAQQLQNDKMIREFKTMPCGLEGTMSSHDHRCCPFFHSERDRRRLVYMEGHNAAYGTEPCDQQFDDQRVCSHGEGCGRCHSTAELLYHPDFFRKRLCHQAKRCPRGRFCAFAHSRQELLVPHFTELEETEPTEDFIAWRFKTQWCPIGGPHDWENCVYAHTYRDWRRIPTLGYSSRPCPHWVQSVTKGPAELLYADRCPRGMSCPLAHGAKEQLYHPQFYKTSPCSEGNCKRGALCAFTHGAHDIRRPKGDEQMPLAIRDPILQAVELLGRSQPTFWSPPRYHALEEPPRNSVASGHSKGRSRNNSLALAQQAWDAPNHGGIDPALLGTDMPLLPAALPSVPGAHGQGHVGENGFSPYGMPPQYPMCQWVPMGAEPQTQLIPPAMGYGQAMDPAWQMQAMGYAPWGCNPYMMGPPQLNGMQPGFPGVSPYMMTMPASPSEIATQLLEATVGEQDGINTIDASPHSASSRDAAATNFCMEAGEMAGAFIPGLNLSPDLLNSLQMGGMPAWPALDEEEALAWQTNHYLRKGLRTPSSLGSPPLSAPTTQAPSPRPIEADSNGSVYQDGSSDGVSGEPHIIEASSSLNFDLLKQNKAQEILAAIAAATMKLPTIETVEEPLALQNFMEAPVPASPPASPARVA